ncbi:MAG: phosphatidylserine decarboxylase family protein [Rhodothermaceae bacterium]|nr:phosphatidylserine decarboxylase family protein [Rhodothermaceae bacterium]MYI83747.1 phosphatidylserine decarboxylase family protein [Rhodothermaceae bacterium]
MIAQEGWPLVAAAFVIGVILAGLTLIIPGVPGWLEFGLIPLFTPGTGLFVAYFFRDPERTPPPDFELLILAPADGKVVEIVQVHEPLFIQGPAWRISIFLSVLDVHVNRVPISGTVKYVAYKPGEYRVAWHPKASTLNEQSQIGLVHDSGRRILFKQIAGNLARRIVYRLAIGDQVQAGERFGLIRFGSRMDVLAAADTVLKVQVGERVRAGVSVLGTITPIEHISIRAGIPDTLEATKDTTDGQ